MVDGLGLLWVLLVFFVGDFLVTRDCLGLLIYAAGLLVDFVDFVFGLMLVCWLDLLICYFGLLVWICDLLMVAVLLCVFLVILWCFGFIVLSFACA